MNRISQIIFLALVFVVSCSNETKQEAEDTVDEQRYRYEDLVFRYLDERHSNKISHNEYYFLVLRSKYLCNACYTISLDSALKIAVSNIYPVPLVVLLNDSNYCKKIEGAFGSNFEYLIDEVTNLDQYSLTDSYPLLFHIKNNKIIDWKRILR